MPAAAFTAPEPGPAPATPAAPGPRAARLQRGPLAPMLALALGAAAALGFAPVGLFAPTLFGLAALYALAEAAPRRSFALGFAWATGHFAVSLRWIAEAFTYQDKMPAWLGWPTVAGLAAFLALQPAAGLWAAHRLTRRSGPAARLWALPAAWIATEWVRGHLLTGFPWNPLAAATLDVPGLAQPAAIVGAFGLSGLIALAAAGIALHRWREPAAVLALAAALTAAERAANPPGPAPALTLLIAQPNIGQAQKWTSAPGLALDTLERLSRRPAASATPRALLWPEVALPDNLLEHEPGTRARLARLLRPGDILLTGGLSVDADARGDATAARNSVFALDHRGRIVARYDKAHLTPGGEYVPLRSVAEPLGLTRLAPGALDFTPGPGPRTLALPGLPAVGVQICYELIFPGGVVQPGARPAWLFNPSNDAWFADSGPAQHLALARLRAIEEGLPVARATPTGISAIIDSRGALAATLPQHAPGAIEAALPAARAPTPFARLGNALPLALALAFAAMAAIASLRRI